MDFLGVGALDRYFLERPRLLTPAYLKFRGLVSKIAPDSVYEMRLGGYAGLKINVGHMLPIYRHSFPAYDEFLFAAAREVARASGRLMMIDIGANVGDSVYRLLDEPGGSFVCIEPDERYFEILERNMEGRANVVCRRALLGEAPSEIAGTVKRQAGTGQVQLGEGRTQVRALDELVAEGGWSPNLIKIDTDGYDFKILKGARATLAKHRPTVVLECDPKLSGLTAEEIVPQLEEAFASYARFEILDNFGQRLAVCRPDAEGFRELTAKIKAIGPGRYYYLDLIFHPEDARA